MPGTLQVLPALGKRTAFINKEEKDYLGVYPQPEIIASDLVEAANQIVEG
jgi:2-haloacid dehalogenase